MGKLSSPSEFKSFRIFEVNKTRQKKRIIQIEKNLQTNTSSIQESQVLIEELKTANQKYQKLFYKMNDKLKALD